MLKKLSQKDCSINLDKGDTFTLLYTDEEGIKENLCSHKIDKPMYINVAKIYEFEDEFGLSNGLAGIVGCD